MESAFLQNIIKSYNRKADERNSLQIQDWKLREREVFLNWLQQEKSKTLLEIGAGAGKDSLYFKEQGLATVSTDISPEMIKLCRKKGLRAEVMNFNNLNFSDHQFDSIWALNCLLHVPKADLEDIFKEISRVLIPSGLFYLGLYGGKNSEGIWEEDHYRPKRFFSFFDDESLKRLLTEWFRIEYFEVVPKEVIGGKLNFQSIILRNRA